MSLEMAHKVILPPKKIISRSFLNSGTLIVNIPLIGLPIVLQDNEWTECGNI
jgi:hypothetical protein